MSTERMESVLTINEIFSAQYRIAWEKIPTELRTSIPSLYLRVTNRGCHWVLNRRKPNGCRRRIPLGPWPDVAPERAGELARVAKRDFARAHGTPMPSITVGRLLAEYRATRLDFMRTGHSVFRSIGPILEAVQGQDAHSLTQHDLEGALAFVATRAVTQANRTRAYLHAFFEWAIDRRAVDVNPIKRIPPATTETPRNRLLSLSEIGDVWIATLKLGYPFGPAVQLLILTSARRDEVEQMKFSDLAPNAQLKSVVWTIRSGQVDERQHHAIPLATRAAVALSDLSPCVPRDQGFVFSTTGATGISGWARAKQRLDRGVNALRAERGCPPMDAWRFSDLRRAFAHHCSETLGEQTFFVDRCLGRMRGLNSTRGRAMALDSNALRWKLQTFEAWADTVSRAARIQRRPASAAA
jgi:integrase